MLGNHKTIERILTKMHQNSQNESASFVRYFLLKALFSRSEKRKLRFSHLFTKQIRAGLTGSDNLNPGVMKGP
jgi:hypothetical protein